MVPILAPHLPPLELCSFGFPELCGVEGGHHRSGCGTNEAAAQGQRIRAGVLNAAKTRPFDGVPGTRAQAGLLGFTTALFRGSRDPGWRFRGDARSRFRWHGAVPSPDAGSRPLSTGCCPRAATEALGEGEPTGEGHRPQAQRGTQGPAGSLDREVREGERMTYC